MAHDPLTDERALMLESSAPDEISALGQHLSTLSLDGGDVVQALDAAKASEWKGKAADAYRHNISNLPKQVQQASDRFWNVSMALDTYGADVGEQKARLHRIAGQLRPAQTTLAQAATRLHRATQALSDARLKSQVSDSSPHAPALQAALADAEREHDGATMAHHIASGDVELYSRQAFDVLDEFDKTRHRASGTIKGEIERVPTSWEVLPPTKVQLALDSIPGTIGHAFANLGPDALAWLKDPDDMDKLSKFADDFGTVVATIGLAAAIAAFPADGPVAAALVAVGDVADTAFDGSLAIKVGADVNNVIDGHGDAGELAGDGALVLLDGVGKVKVSDPKLAVDALEPQYSATSKLQASLEKYGDHPTPDQIHDAILDLPTDERLTIQEAIDKHGLDLSDPKARAAYFDASAGAYRAAKAREKGLDAVNEVIQYGGGDGVGAGKSQSGEQPGEHGQRLTGTSGGER